MNTQQMIPYEVRGVQIAGTPAEQGRLNPQQRKLIIDTIGKDCPMEDIEVLFATAEKYQLNLFGGVPQLYGVPRSERFQDKRGVWGSRKRLITQIALNGLVLIAERTGKFEGMTRPEYCGKPRNEDDPPLWRDAWLYDDRPPVAARVGVWRTGAREPSWGIAHWREFADLDDKGKPRGTWKSMPTHMLAKVAASMALRRAFQAEFATLRATFNVDLDEAPRARARIDDLYAADDRILDTPPRSQVAATARNFFEHEVIPRVERELEPSATGNGHAAEQPARTQANGVKRITDPQRRLLFGLLGEETLREAVMHRHGLEHVGELSVEQANELIAAAKAGQIRPANHEQPVAAEPPLFPEADPDEPPPYDDTDGPEQPSLDLEAARVSTDPDFVRPKARR